MCNIPKLRFPEFKGEWEEKKLSDIASFSKGKGYTKNDLVNDGSPIILYGRMYTKYETVISDIDTFVNLQEGSIISKGGEIIVPASGETAEEISRASVVKNKGIILGGDLNIISLQKDKYNPEFFALTISSGTSQKRLSKLAQGKSVVHLHNEDLSGLQIKVPSLAEQQKIADFLSNVDSLITAETKILNTLQKKKKALMQKLFTRQLRFKSADGTNFPAWEEKKFSEVFIYHQTNTFSRNMLNYEEGDTYNIHYGDILVKFGSYIDFDNSKIPFINSDVTLNKFVSDSFLKDGDIIIADTAEDESAGKVSEVYNINNKKALSGLHTILCRPKQIFASKYLGYFMNSNVYHKQIVKLLVGTKVLSINKSVIADTIIQIPCLAEQQKIADCLSSMDSLIQTQQKVVTTWHQRKKALLQQMFV